MWSHPNTAEPRKAQTRVAGRNEPCGYLLVEGKSGGVDLVLELADHRGEDGGALRRQLLRVPQQTPQPGQHRLRHELLADDCDVRQGTNSDSETFFGGV